MICIKASQKIAQNSTKKPKTKQNKTNQQMKMEIIWLLLVWNKHICVYLLPKYLLHLLRHFSRCFKFFIQPHALVTRKQH